MLNGICCVLKLFNIKIIVLIMVACAWILDTAYADKNSDYSSRFDHVLHRYVSDDGLVDYKGLKGDTEFPEFIQYLADADPDLLETDNDRLAFWINAYNAFVLSGVIEAYPVKSVLKIGIIPHSFFRLKKFQTKHGGITLNNLEGKKIREAFNEPRIHFAVNCASGGCPKLVPMIYKSATLEQQLDERAKEFINNRKKNYLDKENGILYLSRIFKWYEGDFTKDNGSLENYIIKYLNKNDAEYITKNSIKIEYLEYDWDLNDINR